MRLIDPGTGEITDRLTILSLKVLHGEAAGKDVSHFRTEQIALLSKIRARTLNGAWFEQVLALAAINAALWQQEDALRAHRSEAQHEAPTPVWHVPVVETAFRIQELNDQRAKVIDTINKATGESLGQEKL